MNKSRALGAAIVVCLILAGCSAHAIRPLVDPFPLLFPLVEAGTLAIDGHVVGQPRARDGIIYYATREGYITAVVASSRGVLWRFKADHSISSSIELAGDFVLFHDDGGVIYGIVRPGQAILKKKLDAVVKTSIRIIEGGLVLGTADGKFLISEPDGNNAGEHKLPEPDAEITAGPVPVYDKEGWSEHMLFGRSDGRLVAVGPKGRPVWEFAARGAITADPAVAGGRVCFGTSDRMFYCLDAMSGKQKWSRRLQGGPVGKILVKGHRIVVAASNSVVYTLSAKGGSILSWEAVPSRIIHEMTTAGPLVLVTSASPTLVAFDPSTGKRVGQYEAPGPLVAGAVWVPPFVVVIADDSATGRQNLVFLRSKSPFPTAAAKI
jgi:outer membrane protein assembly factor BamB